MKLCYSPGAASPWTFSISCDDWATSNSSSFGSGAGEWSKKNGAIQLSTTITLTNGCCDDGTVFDVEIGAAPPCIREGRPIAGNACICNDGTLPPELLVTIPGGFPVSPQAALCQAGCAFAGDYVVEFRSADETAAIWYADFPTIDACCADPGDNDGTRVQVSIFHPESPGDPCKVTVFLLSGATHTGCYSVDFEVDIPPGGLDCCALELDVPFLQVSASSCGACFAIPCNVHPTAVAHISGGIC
jgi:hypothetical protein